MQTIQTILREQGRNVIKTQNPRALVCALEEHREAMEGLEGGFFLEHTSTDVSLAAYTLHAGNMYNATKGPSSSVLWEPEPIKKCSVWDVKGDIPDGEMEVIPLCWLIGSRIAFAQS